MPTARPQHPSSTRERALEIAVDDRTIAGTLIAPDTRLPGVMLVHGWDGSQVQYLARARPGGHGLHLPHVRPARPCPRQGAPRGRDARGKPVRHARRLRPAGCPPRGGQQRHAGGGSYGGYVFLASPACASYITGIVLPITGTAGDGA